MKVIRWNAVGPLAGISALLALFAIFLLNPIVKWALQKGGESVFGARVDIDSVSVKIGQSAIVIRGVHVADKTEPMTNLFEWHESKLNFQALPILEKKVIIDEAVITGLKFGTPRKTSGALPFVEKKPGFVGKASERLWAQIEPMTLGKVDEAKSYVDPKTVINTDKLASVKAAENAKATLQDAPATIQNDLKSLNAESRAAELKQRVESVGKGAQGVDGALQTLGQVNSVKKDIQSFKSDIDHSRQQVMGRIDAAKSAVADVKKAREEDWTRIKALVSLPSFDKASLARSIFGPELVSQYERGLGFVHTARTYMPAKAVAPPPPPRGQGRVIEFPLAQKPLPRMLLKKALLSGEVGQEKPLSFQGVLADLTSNPPLWGRPAVGTITGSQGGRSLNAALTLDYTQETPREALKAAYAGFALGAKTVGQESFRLVTSQGAGSVQADVSITGDNIGGRIGFQANNLKVDPKVNLPSTSPIAQRLNSNLTSSLSKVNAISVGVGLGGTLESPSFNIDSNIGEIVSGALKNAFGAEVAEQEKALRAELNKHTDAAIQQLEGQIAQLQSQFLPQLSSQNKVVDDLLAQLSKKATGGSSSKPLPDLKKIFGR